ncbi:preprotein translocase subunit YajC [Microcella daejeonensis]|uniref:Preprotein translocase subunit YajC n=1 Tax=Microcella daejeonensis TaxID=2994971 RepID=A0A9E8MKC6_9MICO|nr:preprotein translocase subunit YajC [Microcella daejeonensis]WAB81174.1 preprotein translocase subunit YajC [Microcella daejeonensis]
MDPLTIVMLAVLALLIFFMFRNSKKRKEEMAKLQDKMVPGAEIMTNFGLFGTLVSVDEENNVAVIETAPGSTVRVHRQTLARVVEDDEALVAGDDDVDAVEHEAPQLNVSSVDPAVDEKRSGDK